MNSLVTQLRGAAWPQTRLPVIWRPIRKRALKHRRAIAVAVSVLLHALAILALLGSRPTGLDSGGSGGLATGAGTGQAYAAIDLDLVAKTDTATVKTADTQTQDALDTPVDAAKPQTDTLTTPDSVAQLASTEAAAGGPGQAGNTAGTGAGDDLWGAIAPCWKRIAGVDTLPVTLQITFGGTGGLSKPPVIVRAPDAAITPQSLRSEGQALSALAACGAYPMAAGRQDVTVNFPKPD